MNNYELKQWPCLDGKLFLRRCIMRMHLMVGFILYSVLLMAGNGYSQRINLHVNHTPLETVIKELHKQSGFDFIYSPSMLRGATEVTLKLENAAFNDALHAVFHAQPLQFVINGKTVVIQPREAQTLLQQSQRVEGVVTDRNQTPLPGVTVNLKGTSVVSQTDARGRFSINLAAGRTILSFSMLGYERHEVQTKPGASLTITLAESIDDLEEVVVIGYGEVARKDLTGSVGTVKMTDLEQAPVMSFEQALAGRIAGVQVTSSDGQPGSEGINIVIRGLGSLTQSTAPLYVIDGFPMEDFDAASLNIDDIESINVLKDASATAIFGARGANGVIVVETKQGKIGLPEVSYTGSFGFQNVTQRMEMMTPYDFVRYQLERSNNSEAVRRVYTPAELPETSEFYNPDGNTLESYRNVRGIDWQSLIFQNGLTAINTMALRGGTDQTKYSVSTSLYNQQGIVINSGSNRFTGRVSLDQNISKKVKLGLIGNYSTQPSYGQISASNAQTAGHAYGYLMYAAWGFRPVTGREDLSGVDESFIDEEYDEEAGTGTFAINPVQTLRNEDRRTSRITFTTNAYLDYNINNQLLLKVTGGYNSGNTESTAFYNSKTNRGSPLNPSNSRGITSSLTFTELPVWKTAATLTFRNKNRKIHNATIMGGVEYQERGSRRFGMGSQLIPEEDLGLGGADEGVPTVNSIAFSENRLASAFARVNYNLRSKYLFTATMRADGSSKFPVKNRWGYFPSGAFAWRISQENFLKNIQVISDAKLRISYGHTGNNRVSDFGYLSTITGVSINESYSFNNADPIRGYYPGVLGNDDLKWETTKQLDAGLDFGMFRNRLTLVVDAYRKYTTDLLLHANIPTHIGFNRAYKNIGELRNDGLEISLNTINYENKNFSWSSSFNISFNRNKVISLTADESRMLSPITWDALHNGSMLYTAQVGQQAALFMGYIFDGIYQYEDFDQLPSGRYVLKNGVPGNGTPVREDIQPGDIKFSDLNGDGTVNEFDETIIGNPLPKHIGGFSNNFAYKGLSLGIFFQWSYGNEVFNANRIYFEGGRPQNARNQFATYNDRWTPENPSNTHFRAGGQGPNGRYSSKYIEDASFLRLKTVSLAYRFPAKWLSSTRLIKSLSVTANAQNLVTWTNYSGMDPEVSVRHSALTPGFDWSPYPRNRIIVFGIKSTL